MIQIAKIFLSIFALQAFADGTTFVASRCGFDNFAIFADDSSILTVGQFDSWLKERANSSSLSISDVRLLNKNLTAAMMPDRVPKNISYLLSSINSVLKDNPKIISPGNMAMLEKILLDQMSQFANNLPALKIVLRTMALLGSENPKLIAKWLQIAKPMLMRFDGRDLGDIMQSLAALKVDLRGSFVEQWFAAAAIHTQKDAFDCVAFGKSIAALRDLKIVPKDDFLKIWYKSIIRKMNSNNLEHQSMASSIWAMAKNEISPPPVFIDAWMNSFLYNIKKYSPDEVAISLWSITMLDPKRLEKIVSNQEVIAKLQASQSDFGRRQAGFALSYASHVLKIPRLPSINLDASSMRPSITQLQRQAYYQIKDMGIEVDLEKFIPQISSSVDLILPKSKIILELDGSQHYVLDAGGNKRLSTSDQRRDEILQALGYRVYRFENGDIRAQLEALRGIQ